MRFVILTTLAMAALAVPAVAKDKKPVDPDKKVCRREQVTGSVLAKSVCHTAAEWREIDQKNADATSTFGNQRTTGAARQ